MKKTQCRFCVDDNGGCLEFSDHMNIPVNHGADTSEVRDIDAAHYLIAVAQLLVQRMKPHALGTQEQSSYAFMFNKHDMH